MTTYPEYSRLDEVYFYLGESHFLMNQVDQALPYFTKVVTDYPSKKLAKEATKRLAEIEKRKAAQKAAPVKKD
jgi:outer membrane protein assembly factor BamD